MVASRGSGRQAGRGWILKGHKETFGDDEYVHNLDCGRGFRGMYIA